MNKAFLKEYVKPSAVLLGICLAVSLALAAANLVTKDRIASLNEQAKLDALASVCPNASFEPKEGEIPHYLAIGQDGKPAALIFNKTAKGYGGTVEVMVAVWKNEVQGVAIVDVSSETVGLGQKASESEFYGQYVGKSAPVGVNKTAASDTEIKAITGATITSKAITEAVNAALNDYQTLTDGVDGYGKE